MAIHRPSPPPSGRVERVVWLASMRTRDHSGLWSGRSRGWSATRCWCVSARWWCRCWRSGWSAWINNNAKGLIQPSQNGFGSEAFGEGNFARPSISLSRRPPCKSILTAGILLHEELNAVQSISVQVPADVVNKSFDQLKTGFYSRCQPDTRLGKGQRVAPHHAPQNISSACTKADNTLHSMRSLKF